MVIDYSIKRNVRARRIRIAVHSNGDVVISAPQRTSDEYIAKLVANKRPWIERAVLKYKNLTIGLTLAKETVDRKAFAQTVKDAVLMRASVTGVRVKKVSIRKMRSRWGSCSNDGNISINLLLGHLPDDLLEYVIVHELCHLVHHNHSRAFWLLVKAYLPDFKARKMSLRKYGYLLRQKQPE